MQKRQPIQRNASLSDKNEFEMSEERASTTRRVQYFEEINDEYYETLSWERILKMPKKHTTSNKTRKRKGMDLDQIHEDLACNKRVKRMQKEFDPDLPGEGQFYCVECSRHFIDDETIKKHRSSKVHRQRIKALHDPPYSQREAEIAGGLGI